MVESESHCMLGRMPTVVVLNHKYSKKAHYGQILVCGNSKEKSKEEKAPKGKEGRKLW